MRFSLPCFFLAAAAFVLGTSATAQVPDYARMDTLLDRASRAHKAAGSVVLYKNGRVLYEHGFGQAAVQGGVPVPPTTQTGYRIGSVTKVYTAAMIWQLIDAGKLTTETSLAKFFPHVPNAKTITIGHLLGHRSGLYNITEDPSFGTWSEEPQTRAALLARIAAGKPVFEPGTRASYSNTNFMLLAFILEDLTKKSYAANLEQRITQPLQLTGTRAGVSSRPAPTDAVSYAFQAGAWQPTPLEDLSTAVGAGDIIATPLDVARFLDALLNGKVISAASLARMTAQRDGYGMGLFRMPFDDRFGYGHNGHIDGFYTMADYSPADSLAVVIACNGVNMTFNDLAIGILSLYYGGSYKMPDFTPKEAVQVDQAVLSQYAGTYNFPQAGMDIVVRVEGDGLTAQATGQSAFPLTATSTTEFAFEPAGIRMVFDAPKDGAAQRFVLYQGGNTVPFSRKP